nr:QueT transporter family protein [Veillonella denticariosi]
MSSTRKMTISAMVVALYIVLLYVTQSISFGAYQIRIATSLYALAYAFPFLVIPMGIGNLISNFLFGGLGILDMLGGFGVGILTTGIIVGMRRMGAQFVVGYLADYPGARALCAVVAQPVARYSLLAAGIESFSGTDCAGCGRICSGEILNGEPTYDCIDGGDF